MQVHSNRYAESIYICQISENSSSTQSLRTPRNRLARLRPSQPLLRIKVHRIDALIRLVPVLFRPQRNQRLIRRQQRSRKRIPPINTQPRTSDLHPALHIRHGGQLAGEDLAEQQVDERDAARGQLVLDHGHGVGVPLAAERAEDEAPFAGGFSAGDGVAAEGVHFVVVVGFAGQGARVRVVAVGGDGGVVDHGGFEVEAAVAEVEEDVDTGVVELRGGAAEDLALGEGGDLRDEDFEAGAFEDGFEAVQGGVELDGADGGDGLAGLEVAFERGEEVRGVDADVDENVQRFDLGDVHGDQAAVGVVDEQVAAEGARGVVVDAAGAVGDVAHDEGLDARAELGEDVGDGGREDEQAFGELEGDSFGA